MYVGSYSQNLCKAKLAIEQAIEAFDFISVFIRPLSNPFSTMYGAIIILEHTGIIKKKSVFTTGCTCSSKTASHLLAVYWLLSVSAFSADVECAFFYPT